jgi:deazaflavin-dependent oxidoreductase (nitroreductase family)
MLLTYTGRRSGKRYTIPVTYRRHDDTVTVFTSHSWWKNLRDGATVQVEIKRVWRKGRAEAISEDRVAIAAEFLAQMRAHPALAKSFRIPLDADGQPDAEAVRLVAQQEVWVRIALLPAGGFIV